MKRREQVCCYQNGRDSIDRILHHALEQQVAEDDVEAGLDCHIPRHPMRGCLYDLYSNTEVKRFKTAGSDLQSTFG